MTPPTNPTTQMGGGIDGALLGLVTGDDSPLGAGQFGSHHARLGVYARWTCKGCTTVQYPGRFPCRECCGYTTSEEKLVRGITTVYGRPMAGCPR